MVTNKRQFERFNINFHMEVLLQDNEGRVFRERTILEDISGEGARFQSQDPGRYFPGQSLTVSIWLPGSNEVKASMKGKAKVVRIEPCSNADSGSQSQPVCVAVRFDEPLQLERGSLRTQLSLKDDFSANSDDTQ